jgi:hypothetical protein
VLRKEAHRKPAADNTGQAVVASELAAGDQNVQRKRAKFSQHAFSPGAALKSHAQETLREHIIESLGKAGLSTA